MTLTSVYALYAIAALGAVGVYLVLPGTPRSPRLAGTVAASAALAALLILLGKNFALAGGTAVYFYIFSVVALVGAARVITHPRPVYSAVYFVLVVIAVAGLLVLLEAEFLAAALVLIYAGAILVTYVFVIMLARSAAADDAAPYDSRPREPAAAVLVGFVLTAAIAGRLGDLPPAAEPAAYPAPRAVMNAAADSAEDPRGGPGEPVVGTPAGNTAAVGTEMLTRYVIALELAGVLLLVAMVGGIAVARKRIADERLAPLPGAKAEPPLGQIGREMPPF